MCSRCYLWLTGTTQPNGQKQGRMPKQYSTRSVRAVQEGHRENKQGVVFWMLLTVLGGAGFLGRQAWEWNNLIGKEHMTVTVNPFGSHTEGGLS